MRTSIANYTINQIGHINFYYNTAGGTTDYYIDDICYAEQFTGIIFCTQEWDPVCVNGAEYSNACTAGTVGYSSCEYTYGPCEAPDDCNPLIFKTDIAEAVM